MLGGAMTTAATTMPFDTGTPSMFGWRRTNPRHGEFIGLANVGEHAAWAMLDLGIKAVIAPSFSAPP